jgi:hypothetical protein
VKALASREYVMQALSEHGRVCPTARAGRSNSVPPASISRMLKIWIPILAAIGAGIAAAMGLGGQ